MGLRKEGKNIRKSPAWGDNKFVEDCQKLFLKQLSASDFRLVFVMGKEVAHFLSGVKEFKDGFNQWEKIKKIDDLYDSKSNSHTIEFMFNDTPIIFQYITHPCLNNSNLSRRWGEGGYSHEIGYIKKAIKKAELS